MFALLCLLPTSAKIVFSYSFSKKQQKFHDFYFSTFELYTFPKRDGGRVKLLRYDRPEWLELDFQLHFFTLAWHEEHESRVESSEKTRKWEKNSVRSGRRIYNIIFLRFVLHLDLILNRSTREAYYTACLLALDAGCWVKASFRLLLYLFDTNEIAKSSGKTSINLFGLTSSFFLFSFYYLSTFQLNSFVMRRREGGWEWMKEEIGIY